MDEEFNENLRDLLETVEAVMRSLMLFAPSQAESFEYAIRQCIDAQRAPLLRATNPVTTSIEVM